VWDQVKDAGGFRSTLAFVGGAVFRVAIYLLGEAVQPGISVMDRGQPTSNMPSFFWWHWRILRMVNSWPWIGVIFLVFSCLALLKPKRERGWTFALVAGLAFAGILKSLVLKM
jgi:hypothetical protein